MGDPPIIVAGLHRGGGARQKEGNLQKKWKGRNRHCRRRKRNIKAQRADLTQFGEWDIESRVYIFSFHPLIHPLLNKYFLLNYNLFPQLC